MTRRALAFLFIALLARPVHAEIELAAFIKLSGSVLKVEVLRVQGGYSLGSGVVVSAQKVVTNCHVTRDARQIYVISRGVRLPVSSQSGDAEHDLCVLHVPRLEADPVELGTARDLTLGQSVNALGYTGGTGIQNSPGTVLALHRHDRASVIQSSNFFSSGASGGGLFDDQLRLVGILTFRLRGGSAHYFAAPMDWLVPLLERRDREQPVAPLAASDIAFWQRPIQDQPLFLRAALFERDAKWAELRSLALDWARTDATDPEPWYYMGLALTRLDRPADARNALACSLNLAPGYEPALIQLAQTPGARSGAEGSAAPLACTAPPR